MATPVTLTIYRTADFGPIQFTAKRLAEDGETLEPVPLAGWSAYAQVRKTIGGPVVLDLAPVIEPDDAAGLITLPQISHTALATLPLGRHLWDLILEDPDGTRLPPIAAGPVFIYHTVTIPT